MANTLTQTEENYLKAIYKANERTKEAVNTNTIARSMKTSAASVTDMMKKLALKELIIYEKYRFNSPIHHGAARS
jgi:DtxR family Mn-dependent transcriptional regulator